MIAGMFVCMRIHPLCTRSNFVNMKMSIHPATCDYDKICTKFMKQSKLGNALEASWMVSGSTWVAAIAMPTSLTWKIGEHCRITTGNQVAEKNWLNVRASQNKRYTWGKFLLESRV